MSVLSIILFVVGLVGLAKGISISFFPDQFLRIKILNHLTKNKKNLKRLGLLATLVSVILLMIAINL